MAGVKSGKCGVKPKKKSRSRPCSRQNNTRGLGSSALLPQGLFIEDRAEAITTQRQGLETDGGRMGVEGGDGIVDKVGEMRDREWCKADNVLESPRPLSSRSETFGRLAIGHKFERGWVGGLAMIGSDLGDDAVLSVRNHAWVRPESWRPEDGRPISDRKGSIGNRSEYTQYWGYWRGLAKLLVTCFESRRSPLIYRGMYYHVIGLEADRCRRPVGDRR
ncbi:hypothetical protein BV20DRAFT_983892 [Pilatotrama ljubarskyi]|nr:hypothetical protein BV20DRAFT_983892 [Pilatotrama ljubarskyi]